MLFLLSFDYYFKNIQVNNTGVILCSFYIIKCILSIPNFFTLLFFKLNNHPSFLHFFQKLVRLHLLIFVVNFRESSSSFVISRRLSPDQHQAIRKFPFEPRWVVVRDENIRLDTSESSFSSKVRAEGTK